MKRPAAFPASPRRVLIFVDESNVTSSAKVSNRKLDWIKLRDFLVGKRALFTLVPNVREALWELTRETKLRFYGARVSIGTAIEVVVRQKGDVSPG